MQLINFPTV